MHGSESYSVERASLRIDSAFVDSQYVAGRFVMRNFRGASLPFPLDSLDFNVTGTPAQAAGNMQLWARGDTIVLATTLTLQRTAARITVALDSLLASLYGVQMRLEAPAQITLEDRRLTLDGLAVTSDIGTLRSNGFVQLVGRTGHDPGTLRAEHGPVGSADENAAAGKHHQYPPPAFGDG